MVQGVGAIELLGTTIAPVIAPVRPSSFSASHLSFLHLAPDALCVPYFSTTGIFSSPPLCLHQVLYAFREMLETLHEELRADGARAPPSICVIALGSSRCPTLRADLGGRARFARFSVFVSFA